MKNHLARLTVLFVAAALLFFQPIKIQAQNYGYFDQTFLNYALASQKAEETRRGLRSATEPVDFNRLNAASSAQRTTKNPKTNVSSGAARGTSTFASSGSFIVPKEFAQQFGKTAAEKREAENAFVKGLSVFDEFLASKGQAKNDVARASSALFVMCLFTYSGKPLTTEQKDGIYNAFRKYYETDAYFQSLNDRERQKNYESNALLWSFVFIAGVTAGEKGDQVSLQKAKEKAEYIFRQFIGVPISSVRMKSNGFEID